MYFLTFFEKYSLAWRLLEFSFNFNTEPWYVNKIWAYLLCSMKANLHCNQLMISAWAMGVDCGLISVCGCVWACAYKCVCPGSGRRGPIVDTTRTSHCYLVSQVLRLCCSSATGAKTFPCTQFCGLLVNCPPHPPPLLFARRECPPVATRDLNFSCFVVLAANIYSLFFLPYIFVNVILQVCAWSLLCSDCQST